jgi:hypothetical protein
MTLRTRLAKLEVVVGGRVPTEREFCDAMKLCSRYFEAIVWPEILADTAHPYEPDPAEVVLMKAAAAAGQIAAAEDVRHRYMRAHGYQEQTIEEAMAQLAEVFPEASKAYAADQDLAAKAAVGRYPNADPWTGASRT